MTTNTARTGRHNLTGLPPAKWSDEQLLVHYRQTGNQKMFAVLVQRYEQELFHYLRHYLGDSQLAEDTFQTTFLHVHLKRDQFDQQRRFRPWLYKIATNRAIDNIRQRKRRATVSLDMPCDPQDPNCGAWADRLIDSSRTPTAQLIHQEHCDTSLQALQKLPKHLRQVLTLVFFQGLKYRETAEVLSIPVGTVKSRMHTALQKLEAILVPPSNLHL